MSFKNIAIGSLEECRYYLRLAKDLGYADTTEQRIMLETVSRMLTKYSAAIRADF